MSEIKINLNELDVNNWDDHLIIKWLALKYIPEKERIKPIGGGQSDRVMGYRWVQRMLKLLKEVKLKEGDG